MTNPDDPLITDSDGGIERLRLIMACLRAPDAGCPWDIEQDFASIAPYTIEEAYEVADAVERQAWCELEDELGDLLLQSVYFAQMGQESGYFDFDSIVRRICDKMVARHPHVFGDKRQIKTAEQQSRDWETLKASERAKSDVQGALSGVALALPALMRAQKLQKRAARVGFDWPDVAPALSKLREEIEELEDALEENKERAMDELGDVLFSVVNIARKIGIDAELALKKTNKRFSQRFSYVERAVAMRKENISELTLKELDHYWDEAKLEEKVKNT